MENDRKGRGKEETRPGHEPLIFQKKKKRKERNSWGNLAIWRLPPPISPPGKKVKEKETKVEGKTFSPKWRFRLFS